MDNNGSSKEEEEENVTKIPATAPTPTPATLVIPSLTETEKDSLQRDGQKTTLPPDVTVNQKVKMEEATRMDAYAQAELCRAAAAIAVANNTASDPPRKNKGWKHFWKGTMADMKNKNLIPVKTLFFFKAATLFVLYPFLTLHIKSLGLDAAEAGINSAFIPVVAILASPFAGIIADKIGNFKVLLSSLTFANAGLSLLLLLVPVAREPIILPNDLTFAITCSGSGSGSNSAKNDSPHIGSFSIKMVGDNTCTLDLSSTPWDELPPSVVQCGSLCSVTPASVDKSWPTLTSLPVLISSSGLQDTFVLSGKKAIFTPFRNKRPDLVCSGRENNSCFLAFADDDSEGRLHLTVETTISQLASIATRDPDRQKIDNNNNVTRLTFAIKGKWNFANHQFQTVPTCMGITSGSDNSKKIGGGGDNVKKCRDECLVNFKRSLFCSNTKETIVYDVALTFWLYTVFRVILGLGSAMTWIMFEGAVLAILKETGGDYGLQRVSAVVAAIFVSPASGALISYFGDFRPAFYLYALLQVISALFTLWIDLTFKQPAEKILGHLKDVLSQVEIIIFFVAMLLSGSVWGYLESFLFWFLKNLGGSEILMGLTISVGGLAGLPLLISSRVIIKKIGHVNVLCLGLLFYFIRLLGYSFIEDPWLCLPFEAMEAITASLAITAAATYAAALSTEQTIASIQGVMGALYFGFGRGIGSLIGGFLIQAHGERVTFQIFGFAALVSCVLYFMLNLVYIQRQHRNAIGIRRDRLTLGGGRRDASRKLSKGHNIIDNEETAAQSQAVTASEDMTYQINGGYIGPCDINSFTDVPLDEENISDPPPSAAATTVTNHPKLSRPASFPLSKIRAEVSHNRSSET